MSFKVTQDFITKGQGARPGVLLDSIKGLVIHWIGASQSRASVIRKNFNSDAYGTQYIIDWNDGSIIQCMPENEKAYHVGATSYTNLKYQLFGANNPNRYLVGIECCINDNDKIYNDYYAPDKYMDLGKPSDVQYEALVEFAADFLKRNNLTTDNLYRHYDITGKICHVWFVKDSSRWTQFKADVKAKMEGDTVSKQIVQIPTSDIETIKLYVTNCKKTLTTVYNEMVKKYPGKTIYVLNGGMWNADGSACNSLKVDGVKLSKADLFWSGIYGYGFGTGPDIHMTNDWDSVSNFISCTCLIRGDQKVTNLGYASAQGGRRGRTGIGMNGNKFVMYCSQDGSSDAKTPEDLRNELYNLGCENAIMLDSGGSSMCNFNGKKITGDGRKVHNWIVVVTKKKGSDAVVGTTVNKTYKVTPSSGLNARSGPGSSYGKVGAYAKGTLITVTQESNGWGKTDIGWVSLEYCELVKDNSTTTVTPPATDTTDKTDSADSWAQDSWDKACKMGLFDGTNPKNNMTRQEVAVLLDRLGLLK